MKPRTILFITTPFLFFLLSSQAQAEELATLKSYWHDDRIDFFETATEMGQNAALNVFGYSFVRSECQLYPRRQPDTVSLDLYWSEELQDNATIATAASVETVLAAGYEKKATEGYVFPTEQPGTVPLKLFYSSELQDYYTTTADSGEAAARESGYEFVRVEGYVFPLAADEPAP